MLQVVKASGFAYGESKDALIFLTPEIGVTGGYVHADNTSVTPGVSSAIWRTSNGGHYWQRTTIHKSSNITGLTSDGQNVYATVRGLDGGTNSMIMHSCDTGLSWRVLCKRPDNVIRELHVRDSMHLYYRSDNMKLAATNDGGATWEELDNPISNVEYIFYSDAMVYYLSGVYNPSSLCRLASRNLNTGYTQEIELPLGRRGSTASHGNLLLLYDENIVELYRISGSDITLLSKFEPERNRYTSQFVYSHGDKIYLYLEVHGGGFWGSREKLMFSKDGGVSWERLQLGLSKIWPFYGSTNVLPVGDKFNLYYIPDPLSLGVISK